MFIDVEGRFWDSSQLLCLTLSVTKSVTFVL
jgi:hypothetical protein